MERIKGELHLTKEEASKFLRGPKYGIKPDSVYRRARGRGEVKRDMPKDAFGRVLIPMSALIPKGYIRMISDEIMDRFMQEVLGEDY
jgi:hypothetical protein